MRMQADSRRPTPTPRPWLRPDLRHRGTLARIGFAFALLACADAKAALPVHIKCGWQVAWGAAWQKQ